MVTELPQAHSPLGGSGAHRWMECPGSVGMAEALARAGHVDEESDYATEGSCAHAVGEACLIEGKSAWEYIGHFWHMDKLWHPAADGGVLTQKVAAESLRVTAEMANAVQKYIDVLEAWHPSVDRHQGNTWVEMKFYVPTLHEHFYSVSDFVFLDEPEATLHVWDYKHGAGIVVEADNNPQLLYYACGVMEQLMLWQAVESVVVHIAQPRGFHFKGPFRHFEITPQDLEDWLDDELLPAMDNALVSRDTKSGEHCRFCPVRSFACPQIMADMQELEELMEEMKQKPPQQLTNAQLDRFLDLYDVGKIIWKTAEKTAFTRLAHGRGKGIRRKLVNKRANRNWRDPKKAAQRLKKKYGDKAFTEPGLKSPAQIDALPGGEKLTAELAEKPKTGLTLAALDDTRAEVSKSTKSMFKPVGKTKTTRKK